jgi:hypothetical protein
MTMNKQDTAIHGASVTPDGILQLGFGFWASRTLLSAIDLGVFTALAAAPTGFEALRGQLGLHPRAARDFLDALVALGMLERDGDVYRNTIETDRFLDKAKPSYVGGILEMGSQRLYGFWGSLTAALRSGERQSDIKAGADLFAQLYADPVILSNFLRAMSGISAGAAQAMAAKFDWAPHRTFVDVGTAQGMVPVTLARAHSHLSGFGFDLPQVQPVFEAFVADQGLSDRIRFMPGSFFEQPIPTADVIVMGHILHDWDLATKKLLLAKAFAALPKGDVLIVYEALIDDDRRENAFGLLMSLNMLIETDGGFDYTGTDCVGWMREAGFSKTRVEHLVGPDSMVIGIK